MHIRVFGPRPLRCLLGIVVLLVFTSPSTVASTLSGSLSIANVRETADKVVFDLQSTFPAGTSYQPQFLRRIGADWAELPDARLEEGEQPGLFRVSAPRFGGDAGFYRVVNSVSRADDPARNTLEEPDPAEIVLFWAQPAGSFDALKGKVYYHVEAPAGGPVESTFQAHPTGTFSMNPAGGTNSPVGSEGAYDVLMSDLDGDGRVDPLMVWVDNDNRITLTIASVVSTNFLFETRFARLLPDRQVRAASGSLPTMLRVVRAEFAAGANARVWLGWINSEGFVQFDLLEFNASLNDFTTLASYTLPTPASSEDLRDRSSRFDLASGDFNGDGNDELGVITTENITIPNGLDNFQLYVRFFRYQQGAPNPITPDTIAAEDRVLYVKDGRQTVWMSRVAGHAADLDADGRDDLVVVYETSDNSSQSRWFMQFLLPNAALSSMPKSPEQPGQIDQTNGSNGYPLDIQHGEFDGDPLPELVVGARRIQLFDIRTNLTFSALTSADGVSPQDQSDARRFITLANLNSSNPNTGYRPEIIVATDNLLSGNSRQRFTVQSFAVTGDASTFFRIDQDAVLQDEEGSNAPRFLAIGAADFGGNGPKLGTPRRYTRTISGRPVVIVNSPPIHFDVLAGASYDVNGMFPTLECLNSTSLCPFYSRYTVQNAQSIEVATDWKRGWEVGVKVEGGVELPLDVGLKAEIETKFGERFDSFASTNTTTVVEVQVDAVAEDRIYATTVSYTVWEYPVVVNDEVVTYILAYAPDVTRQNWFGSKSIVAQNYRPYHEVGNLLSYRSATEPYPGAEYVREIQNADTFTVDSSSAYVWRLTRTTDSTTRESRTFNFSINAKAEFDIPVPWIPDVTVTGGYDSSALNSSTTRLTDQQGLIATLGALDGSIAGTAYSITPYFYWDRSGALVLDYAVDLSTGTAGQPTFWGQFYSTRSDPAFILPWRLDPEKGLALVNESQRQLTREITSIPPEPRPGEEVDLVARISNFSFLNTPSSFSVRFYLGDPAAGGQLLTSRDGFNSILVPAGIPARGKRLVRFPWRIPENPVPASIRISALIDADNQLEEVHENNNLGWNEIFVRSAP